MRAAQTFQFAPEKGLALDLYNPAEPARAVVLYLHGGGFLKGSRTEAPARHLAQRLVPTGIAVASADYRLRTPLSAFSKTRSAAILAEQARSKSAGLTLAARLCGPEMITALEDADAALRFLVARFNDTPLVVCGVSAGGILGLSLACPPRGMALLRPDGVLAISAALVQPWRLTPAAPPVILLHGHPDRVIGVENPRLALRHAKRRGVDFQLIETGIGGHNPQVAAFFDATDPEGMPFFRHLNNLIARAIVARKPGNAS